MAGKSIPLLEEDKQKILGCAAKLDKARSNAWAAERVAKQRGEEGVNAAVAELQDTLKALADEYLADEEDRDSWSINLDEMEFRQPEPKAETGADEETDE
jgi:hypothetical protein